MQDAHEPTPTEPTARQTASTTTTNTTTLRQRLALTPEQLRRVYDPASLPFQTTAEVEPLHKSIGQPRAVAAITFGLEIENPGYNLYLSGAPGSGRESIVLDELRRFAPTRPVPTDWIYVYNFTEPDHPNAIAMPPGTATQFASELSSLVSTTLRELPRAFDDDDYERRQRTQVSELGERRNELFEQLRTFASELNFRIEFTPTGISTVALQNDQPLTPEAFQALSEAEREQIEESGKAVNEQVSNTLRQVRQLEKEATERVHTLNRDVTNTIIEPLMGDLRDQHRGEPEVLAYLQLVAADMLERNRDLRIAARPADAVAGPPGAPGALNPAAIDQAREEFLSRYAVNVLIDHGAHEGAPVVFERNPTYYNLIGRTDYRSLFGALVTDFRQIKPGALHRANGGFLVLHVTDLLRQPPAWEALKRALMSREIRIEGMGEQMSAMPVSTLRPEPIPLHIRVILIGSPDIYRLLYANDEDFQELFRLRADFTTQMPWTDANVLGYAAFISRRVQTNPQLRHFNAEAVARVAEYGGRQMEDQRKLSARLSDIGNLVIEASYWATRAGRDVVTREDVEHAIVARIERSNLIEERIQEQIIDGTITIDTSGSAVGQVTGLAVLDIGDYVFGKPSRISARVAVGRGDVRSIEREIDLSGPLHAKGFLILNGYLAGQYAQRAPLTLSATITFEQSYSGIDGDSASSTELYALLSALANLEIDAGIAVTGSVDQHGRVQAIGGATHKIEGFFDICQEQGLTGEQGVMIPATNVRHLMLRTDVVDAVAAGKFHIWAVHSIDEGIELLTGVPAGARDVDGNYPEGTVHQLVEARLKSFAELARTYRPGGDGGSDAPGAHPWRDGDPIHVDR